MFHAGTWAGISRAEAKNIQCNVMSIYIYIYRERERERGIQGADRPIAPKFSDQVFIDDMEVLSPLSLVAYERLTLFARVIRRLQGPLLLVLSVAYDGKRSWLKDVDTTHEKLFNVSERYADMKGKSLAHWVQLIRESPGLFYKG